MLINDDLVRKIDDDLGLNRPFVKGQRITIRNCWHFYTDGKSVSTMFHSKEAFIAGMNRVFIVSRKYGTAIILAFSLMDTHIHFILYGDFDSCNRFMHEFLRRTSSYISLSTGEAKSLKGLSVNYQCIDTDTYLKTVICYTIKNAPAAGLHYTAWDYPWSSGPLYFRSPSAWNSPSWMADNRESSDAFGSHRKREVFKTRDIIVSPVKMTGPIVFPGEYVAVDIVERIFRTCKSFNFFMCHSREEDVESKEGFLSHLSLPLRELRQYKNEICRESFGVDNIKSLDMARRLKLARIMHSRYNSSVKQIARVCGLVYEEVKDLI